MNLSEAQKKQWIDALRELGYLSEEDNLVEHTKGDLWEMIFSQTRGNFLFTNKNFIFAGGLLGSSNFCIAYDKITGIKKCNVGGLIPLIPTGIKITYTNEKGKSATKVCSVLKRNDWIEFLSKKCNVSM